MARLPIEIIQIDIRSELGVGQILGILNGLQDAFEFSLLKGDVTPYAGQNDTRFTTREIYSFLGLLKGRLRGYHPYLVAIVDRRLDGQEYRNLFGSMQEVDNSLSGAAIASMYGLEHILGRIPVAVYIGFELLSFALRFLHGKGLIHDERRGCVFDRKVDKCEIVSSITSGKLCAECRGKLNQRLDEDQELAVEHIFRFFREVANSNNPQEAMLSFAAAIEGDPPRVFLCHSSSDKQFVHRLASDLISSGCRVWFDAWEIKVGDNIVDKISDAISGSDYLGVVLSKSSINSGWVRREWTSKFMQEVDKKGASLLPILLEEVQIPTLLAPLKYADFRNKQSYIDALGELVDAIRHNQSAANKG